MPSCATAWRERGRTRSTCDPAFPAPAPRPLPAPAAPAEDQEPRAGARREARSAPSLSPPGRATGGSSGADNTPDSRLPLHTRDPSESLPGGGGGGGANAQLAQEGSRDRSSLAGSAACLVFTSVSCRQPRAGSLSCLTSPLPASKAALLTHSIRMRPRDSEGPKHSLPRSPGGHEAPRGGHFYLSDIRDHNQRGRTTGIFGTKSAAGLWPAGRVRWLPGVPNGKRVSPLVFTLSPRCCGTSWWSMASSKGPGMHFGTRLGKNK